MLGSTVANVSDDQWTESDDALVAYETVPDDHPVRLSHVFAMALEDPATFRVALQTLVTPESLSAWDFKSAGGVLDGFGLLTHPRSPVNSPDVAYVYAVALGDTARLVTKPEAILVERVFCWVWRPELGSWRLHSITQQEPDPDTLPRSSPGTAPDIGAVPPRAA